MSPCKECNQTEVHHSNCSIGMKHAQPKPVKKNPQRVLVSGMLANMILLAEASKTPQ